MSSRAGPLICQRLSGGLGNQLFQAAAALALARRLGGQLAFDLRRYKPGGLRRYELGPFPHGARIWTPEPSPLDYADPRALMSRLPGGKPWPWGWHGSVYRQPDFGYDPGFAQLEGDHYLFGVFVSELYFADAVPLVRSVFDCTPAASGRVRELAKGWQDEDRTSVHIRRGDYASDARNLAKIGVLDDAYYERAIGLIRAMAPSTRLTFFSDDLGAAGRLAAKFSNAEVVRGDSAIDDLYLISRCRHHINANSTFSWWGAWLGAGGMTIAPRQYQTRERLRKSNISDVFPIGWILI